MEHLWQEALGAVSRALQEMQPERALYPQMERSEMAWHRQWHRELFPDTGARRHRIPVIRPGGL